MLMKRLLILAALCLLPSAVRAQDLSQTARRVVVGVSNASPTGTTLHRLAKLTGAPSKATVVATTDTDGALGVVVGMPGTSGVATIQTSGLSSVSAGGGCDFDGATTAGDYVQISSTAAGKCHSAGSSYPSSGQVVGRVLSTNVGAGTYDVLLTPGVKAAPTTAPGGSDTQAQFNDGGSFGGSSAFTFDKTAKTLTLARGSATSGSALSITSTWTGGGTLPGAIFANVTDSSSAAGSLLIDLQVGAASKFKVDKTGAATFASSVNATSGSFSGVLTTQSSAQISTIAWFSSIATDISGGQTADAGTNVAVSLRSYRTFSTAGAKITSFQNNTTEVAYVDKDGLFVGKALKATCATFASLPTASSGMTACVSDSNVNTWGSTIAGGGANTVLAFYNGAAWTVAGK